MKFVIACLLATIVLQPLSGNPRQMSKEQQIEHALSRLTWGPEPGQSEAVRRSGLKKWIELQLHPERVSENPELEKRLAGLNSLNIDTAAAFGMFKDRKTESIRPIVKAVQEAKVYRAVYTNRQLEDVLTDFWYNHFNVFMDKGPDRVFVGPYERDAIRPHVLGKFESMLEATASHPAMLWYLDNWQSVGSDSAIAGMGKRLAKRARGLNENYGRELLELHTLGVDGGYTQTDVVEVARCFTGWTIRDGRFQFVPAMHDRGQKVVLGVTIPSGGGKEDAHRVIEIVSRHPATAKFISRKLAQRFVADVPPAPLVDAMAKTFLKTDGDLRKVMKTMLNSKQFWSQDLFQAKLKSPLELVVSAARAGQADLHNGIGLALAAERMGQPLYRKLEPTGYANTSEEWKNSASLLARMNLAGTLARNRVPGMDFTWPSNPLTMLAGAPSETLKQGLAGKTSDAMLATEAVLGSPDFQRR